MDVKVKFRARSVCMLHSYVSGSRSMCQNSFISWVSCRKMGHGDLLLETFFKVTPSKTSEKVLLQIRIYFISSFIFMLRRIN